MSSLSSSYRKDRYITNTAARKGKWYLYITLAALFMCLLACGFYIISQKAEHEKTIMQKEQTLVKFQEELAWLRTINPYKGDYRQLEQKALQHNNLFPGWITRVYPAPDSIDTASTLNDVGTFVLNETRFSLTSHHRYGIAEPRKSMYLLSGLLPNKVKGRHQVGIKINIAKDTEQRNAKGMSRIGSCYSRFFINQKRVIDTRISFLGNSASNGIHTGEVTLDKGIYPVSAMIFCDQDSDFNDDEIEISILFRNPTQNALTENRHRVFHIYQPAPKLTSL